MKQKYQIYKVTYLLFSATLNCTWQIDSIDKQQEMILVMVKNTINMSV